mgnify:CR=1 FL=1
MDQLRAMRMFVTVVDEGGFSSASRATDTTPASVTRLIADLEHHLGVRLLNRTTRRISLTSIGEQYLAKARLILSEIEESEALVSIAHKEPQGTTRLKVPAPFAVHQLAKVMPRFAARYPKVTVEVSASGFGNTEVDETYDLTILATRGELDGDFIAKRMASTELILCAAPSYLDRHGRPNHPEELCKHSVLMTHGGAHQQLVFFSAHPASSATATAGVALSSPSGSSLTTASADLAYAGALWGRGIWGLPSFVVEDAILENALERVLPDWKLFDLTLWICMPSRKHVPARTRALVDFLLGEFSEAGNDPWLPVAGCPTRVAAVSRH